MRSKYRYHMSGTGSADQGEYWITYEHWPYDGSTTSAAPSRPMDEIAPEFHETLTEHCDQETIEGLQERIRLLREAEERRGRRPKPRRKPYDKLRKIVL